MKKLFGLFLCVFFVFLACKVQEKPKVKPEAPRPKSALARIESMRAKSTSGVRSFTINEKAKTAVLVLPIDHDFNLSNIKPTIAVSMGASISPSTDMEQDFSSNKTVSYTVTAENGETSTYVASVKVLGARGNLVADSIFVCGERVVGGKVTVPAKYSFVEKKDIMVNFTGDDVPAGFNMSEEKIALNKRGDKKTVTLSTAPTDKWNAWSTPIEITRGDQEPTLSSEKKILEFYISFNVDEEDEQGTITRKTNMKCNISEPFKRITYTLPAGSMYETITANVICSSGAYVIHPVKPINFKNSTTTPIKYKVRAADKSEQEYSVMIGRNKSSNAKIKTFDVVGSNGRFFKGKIDQSSKKILVEVVGALVDITSIKPKITFYSKAATVSPSADVSRDFSTSMNSPLIYTVRAENGFTTQNYRVSVRVLSNAADITSFSLNIRGVDRPCTITGQDIRLPGLLPIGTDVSSLVPTITVSDRATVSPMSGSSRNFTKPVKYVVTAEDKYTKKEYTVTVEVEKSHEAQILEFSIKNREGSIDHAQKTIEVWVSKNEDVTALTPKIKISERAKVEPESGAVQNFTNPIDYKVTAEDGTTENTYKVTVKKGKSDKAKIRKFTIDGVDGAIDEGAKKIFVDLPTGHALKNITPEVIVSVGAFYTPTGAQDFTDSVTTPIKYTVISENNINTNIYDVSVRAISKEAKITQFKIGDQDAKTIADPNGATHGKILVILPKGHALNVEPIVKVSQKATYTPTGAQDFTNSVKNPIEYIVTAEDGKTKGIYDVTVRCISDKKEITEFMVGAVKGRINQTKLTISAEVPHNVPLTTITPMVTISEYATLSPASNTPQDFTGSLATPKNYKVTAEDGSEKTYKVTILQESKSQRYTIHDVAVSSDLKVEVPNSVTSISVSDIKAWFTDGRHKSLVYRW